MPNVLIQELSQFSFDGNFEEQVQMLLDKLRKPPENFRQSQLYSDLRKILRQEFQHCELHPFGSAVTGLSIKGSDIDIYTSNTPPALEPIECVEITQHLLRRERTKFQNVFAIKHARAPIVKFIYAPTEIECDISFNSGLVVRNSEFFSFVFQLEPEYLQLALLIKIWSKAQMVCGTNLVPNYALLHLILFYLQHRGLVPSIQWMQCNTKEHVVIDDWEYGYVRDRSTLPKVEVPPLHDLLGGFFKFYHEFQFDNFAVSPWLGRPVAIDVLSDVKKTSELFPLYDWNVRNGGTEFSVTKYSIQDVFIHTRNVSVSVSKAQSEWFNKQLLEATKVYDDCVENNEYSNLLPDILKPHATLPVHLRNIVANKNKRGRGFKRNTVRGGPPNRGVTKQFKPKFNYIHRSSSYRGRGRGRGRGGQHSHNNMPPEKAWRLHNNFRHVNRQF